MLQTECGHFHWLHLGPANASEGGNKIAQLKGYAESSGVIVALGRQEKCRSVGRQPLIWVMYMKSFELQMSQCF